MNPAAAAAVDWWHPRMLLLLLLLMLVAFSLVVVTMQFVPSNHSFQIEHVCGCDGGGVDEGRWSVGRRVSGDVMFDEGCPLLGQSDKLVGRVVVSGVNPVLEVGRCRDLRLLLLLGKHLDTAAVK